jgi:hypothetical protein
MPVGWYVPWFWRVLCGCHWLHFVGGVFAGDTITLMRPAAGQPTWSGCAEKDVVDPDDPSCVDEVLLCRYRLMKLRTEWVSAVGWEVCTGDRSE